MIQLQLIDDELERCGCLYIDPNEVESIETNSVYAVIYTKAGHTHQITKDSEMFILPICMGLGKE
jgi:hypothetical protein